MTDGAPASSPRHGPFHRLASPTQSAEITRLQIESGELWGRAPFGSDWPQVQAYRGPLPDDMPGIEFYSSARPDDGEHPYTIRWSNREGPRAGVRTEGEFAKIDCEIVKVRMPEETE